MTAKPRAEGPHGYGAYTRGCRCDTCRAAKADYMRRKRGMARATARANTTGSNGAQGAQITGQTALKPGAVRYLAFGVKHGTRHAYDERGCRCPACTTARSAHDSDRQARKAGGDAA